MKELSIERMDLVSGGKDALQCGLGILGMGIIAFAAFSNPPLFAAALLSGPGTQALGGATALAAYAIVEGC